MSRALHHGAPFDGFPGLLPIADSGQSVQSHRESWDQESGFHWSTHRLRYNVVQPGLIMAFVRLGESEWRLVGEWPMAAMRIGSVGLVTTASGQDVERNKAAFDNFMVLPTDR